MSDCRPERIEELGRAVYPSFALLAGMQLDLFTALAAGPLTASRVAAATATDAGKVRTLLYALVNAGLLTVEAERFANTPEAARYLVRGRDGCLLERRHLWSELWGASLQTAASVRSGVPQARKDFAAMSPPELGAFLSGLHPNALTDGRRFAARFDLSDRTALVDGELAGDFDVAMLRNFIQILAPDQEEEHRVWLSEAGFDEIERVDADIIRARKPASS